MVRGGWGKCLLEKLRLSYHHNLDLLGGASELVGLGKFMLRCYRGSPAAPCSGTEPVMGYCTPNVMGSRGCPEELKLLRCEISMNVLCKKALQPLSEPQITYLFTYFRTYTDIIIR